MSAGLSQLCLDGPYGIPTERFESGWLNAHYDRIVESASLESAACPRRLVCATRPDGKKDASTLSSKLRAGKFLGLHALMHND